MTSNATMAVVQPKPPNEGRTSVLYNTRNPASRASKRARLVAMYCRFGYRTVRLIKLLFRYFLIDEDSM